MSQGALRDALKRSVGMIVAAMMLLVVGSAVQAEEENSVNLSVEASEETTFVFFDSVQQASVLAVQTSHGNTVIDIDNHRQTRIENSLHGSVGIHMFNVDAGNLNNQANIRVITIGVSPGSVLVDIEILAATQLTYNTIEVVGGSRSNTLYNALVNVAGVFAVNQSVGNLNNQFNVFTLSIGAQGDAQLVALNDIWLAKVRGENGITLDGVGPRTDYIGGGSFSGFSGVGQVNQSAGDGNTIINSIGISAQVVNLP